MVPHLRVEEAILEIIDNGDEGDVRVVVASVPDERKGERLVVIHVPLEVKPDDICRQLAAAGLPNLWIPSPDSFLEVESIPVLGSGKIDLKAVAELAKSRFQGDDRATPRAS
jgi:acyl-[acyl-carrier-protein]-phospholipid O-acyltransferase/long-chain-fatty-acid--[acyl-carrier-protein] ligase